MALDGMVGDLLEEKFNNRFILRGELSGRIEQLIQDWALLHTRQEITEWGQSRHHPWGPVMTPDELLENEQLLDRGYFIEIEDPENDTTLIYPGAPYKLTQSPWQLRHAAPKVGEHNIDVYSGDLGLSAADLEVLTRARVI